MDHPKLEEWKTVWRERRSVTMVYILLRISVVLVMLAQIFNGNFENVFLCVLTLILFMMPSVLEKKLDITLPNTLEIIILGLTRRNAGAYDPGLHAPLAEYGLRDRGEHHITAHLRTHVADHADVRLGRGLARQHRGAGVPFGAGDQTGHAT